MGGNRAVHYSPRPMAGNANAYLYNALADNFTTARRLYNQSPTSFFGPLAAAQAGNYFLANGLILSSSLAVTGVPSWNLAFFFSLKVTDMSPIFMSSASSGTNLSRS